VAAHGCEENPAAGPRGQVSLILEDEVTAAIVREPASRDSLPCDYVFDINGRFLEVRADNDLLAYAIIFELFPRERAVLLAKRDV
jgi:hypothetical protein